MVEETLILIKPDAVERNLRGEIIRRIEAKGYEIKEMNQLTASQAQLSEHYQEHVDKAFYQDLIQYMAKGPLVALIVAGEDVIPALRNLIGATNPTQAAPGSIRGDLARARNTPTIENLIHGSDSAQSAAREIEIWFPQRNSN